ncbi:MAG: hypothetical protein C5B55_10885, partial [Blastocatellia bacterium]
MPIWIYDISPLKAAIVIVVFVEILSIAGLLLIRRFVRPRLGYHEGANDAVSGTVQAIGVFYGITVGLLAVGVWNTFTSSSEIVSREAAAIGILYRDVSGYPSPLREQMQGKLKEYTVAIIDQVWPAQKKGEVTNIGAEILNQFQTTLYSFDPKDWGQQALHGETLKAYNNLLEYRRLRIDSVGSGLSLVMWAVIWVGAAISIGVAYFFNIPDLKLHAILIGLMGGFLAMVLFMIVINDKPFYGHASISSDSYKIVLDRVIN